MTIRTGRMPNHLRVAVIAAGLIALLPAAAGAQNVSLSLSPTGGESFATNAVGILALTSILALAPGLLMVGTAFIRVAAARLMLDEGLPEAALDVTRQLSDAVLRSPQGALLRARTEAQAGDPGAALAMLRRLPSEDETRRIAADALVRLGRPVDAAREMDAMTAPADQVRRAHLLYEAKAWEDAAGAYATVLRNPVTPKEAKADAADRYALAVAMSGGRPAEDLRGLGGLAGKVLGALPVATASIDPTAPVNALRGALERAGAIEALLPPVPRAQPTKPAPTGRQGT